MFKTTTLFLWITLSSIFNQNQIDPTKDTLPNIVNTNSKVVSNLLDTAPAALALIPVQPDDHILSIDTSDFSFTTIEKAATLILPNKDLTFVFQSNILQDRFFVIDKNHRVHTLDLFLLNTDHPLKNIILEALYDLVESPHTYLFLYIKKNNKQDQQYLSNFGTTQILIGEESNSSFYLVKLELK